MYYANLLIVIVTLKAVTLLYIGTLIASTMYIIAMLNDVEKYKESLQ